MSERTGRKLTRTFLAYIAGLLDGEGCLRLKGSVEEVSITSCYPHHLCRIRSKFGGTLRHFPPKDQRRGCYRLVLYGPKALFLLEKILPYLQEKRYQALLMMTAGTYPMYTSKWASIDRALRSLKRVEYLFSPEELH